jgi:hypothetical protein
MKLKKYKIIRKKINFNESPKLGLIFKIYNSLNRRLELNQEA